MQSFYLSDGVTKSGPFFKSDIKRLNIYKDTLIWKEGWEAWKRASDIPEFSEFIKNEPPPLDYIEELEEKERKSIIDKFLEKSSNWIDEKLENNSEKIGSYFFYTYLSKIRLFYLNLPFNKKRAFLFFLSTSLVFLVSSVILTTKCGYAITKFYVAFIALNQIKAIEQFINWITEIVIFFSFIFLPESLRSLIAKFAKNISILILAYLLGWIIAPVYILYRLVLFFLPNEEGEVTPDLE